MLNLCMNCMHTLENDEDICPKCQEPRNSIQPEPFLAKGKIIGERYIVGNGIKKDPEGLSYIGYDFIKNSKVYIREFFPYESCTRTEKGELLVGGSANSKINFNVLLEDFLKYFRGIARFRNLSSIVSVYDILEQNNTAYVIMEWVEGVSLERYLGSQGGKISWEKARALFMPLLSPLGKMNSAGIRHLGLAPCNMIITDEDKIKIVGFATNNLRTNNKFESSELFEGCSAIEQYISNSETTESTDVYGFAATLFYALTGELPLSAPERKKRDVLLMPSDTMESLPETVVSAIATALRVYPNSRTISFEILRVELSNSPILRVKDVYEDPEEFEISRPEPDNNQKNKRNIFWIISCTISLIVLVICLVFYWMWIKDKNVNSRIEIPEEKGITSQNLIASENSAEGEEEKKVEVPQLIGKTVSEAEKGASSSNPYTIVVLSEEFHDSIPEGNIISQSPAYGEKMYVGSIITVNVSKGPSKRTLPNIEGKSLSEASLILTDAKFVPIQIEQNSDKFAEGKVIGYQGHQAGDLVDYGSEICIIVSKG